MTEIDERRLSRDELLKWAAAEEARPLGRARRAAGTRGDRRAGEESGRLQVLDWAGYEVKTSGRPTEKKYPGERRSSRS